MNVDMNVDVEQARAELRAECGDCFGLCCVALAFTKSADFAEDKQAGDPCRHLGAGHACGVHDTLRDRGYAGCTVYDCLGAGQKLSQVTFGGRDWRGADDGGRAMFAALPVMRQMHELLWYLTEARTLPAAAPMLGEIERAATRVDALTRVGPQELAALDPAAERAAVNGLLLRISAAVRSRAPGPDRGKGNANGKGNGKGNGDRNGDRRGKGRNRRGADLVGARLRGADLRGADLRGACLIGADLRDADLRLADLIGADLRDTDLRGADLTGALFVTASQLTAARGDARTRVPAALSRPRHWSQRS